VCSVQAKPNSEKLDMEHMSIRSHLAQQHLHTHTVALSSGKIYQKKSQIDYFLFAMDNHKLERFTFSDCQKHELTFEHDRSRRTYKGFFAQKNICKVVDPEAVGFEEPVSSYHD
jgi:hypothetical protein